MSVLKRPWVSQKVSSLNKKGTYGLVVHKRANKIEIKKEVERIYGVTVERVNTMHCTGKKKNRYTGKSVQQGRRAGYKKALITLKPGDLIDFYGQV